MATLLRISNGAGRTSPFWYAAFNYRGADGSLVRVKKSTGAKDRREAQRIANELELRANELASGRMTVERMRTALVELTERITGEAVADYTAEGWIREWLEQKAAVTKPRTMERYRFVLERFLAFIGTKAKRGLEHVRPGEVRAFRQQQLDAGKLPVSCNLEIKIVSMPFRKAQRLGIIKLNPAEAVESLDGGSERRQPFTLEQVRAIVAAAPDAEWRGLIMLGFYSGARLGDCARMRWECVDLHAGVLRFKPAKTTRGKHGREVAIPMHPTLHAHLMKLDAPDDGTAFVFPALAAAKLPGNTGLSRRFQDIMWAAGVSAPLARERGKASNGKASAGRSVASLTFHSLRHTLTSLLHNAGVSPELRMQVTGHSTAEAHGRYTHTEIETLRGALASVPEL
ncbi:MAG: tyrosine-type recombinase/integrase [Roseimicrobium sp.]